MLRKVFGDATWFVRDDLRPLQRRVVAMMLFVGVAFLLLLGRLWVLQVLQTEKWRRAAENNRLRRIPLEAPRGTVTDVRGEILLDNRPSYQLLLFPEEMKDPAATEAFLIRIGIADAAEVRARVARARRTSHLPSIIADNLRWPQVAAVAAHQAEFSELQVHPATRRFLPEGPSVAHLVGQLGEVSPEQLAANPALRPGQLVGRSGLERAYQDVLGGTPGNLVVVVDALGKQVSSLDEEPPVLGHPLQVTIDLQLQREAAAAMAGQVGAVVALDPRDGAVRVLLSQPAFDPDLFAGHLEPARWRELNEDPLKPLHNRALQALYPPGSTIKPIYAAGALHSGERTPADGASCSGAVTIFGHPYRCWLKGGHGGVNLYSAIEASCDTYFYRLAQDVGIEKLAAWATLFGLGEATGIELAGESSGLVPSDAWSRRVRGHPWYGGETISVGIGQGPILATPMQLAVAYAALVNGGYRVTPHLAARSSKPPKPLGLQPETLAAVRRGMELVVHGERGTARRWSRLPASFAGKTGTSQVVRKVEGVKWYELPWEQRHHALFVGYAPPEAPTLVVAVVVEHGGDAAAVAAPIAARIFQRALAPGFDTSTILPVLPEGVTPGPGASAAVATRPAPSPVAAAREPSVEGT
ncbi:MAG TPA: penicillin-binding protein 2 [Thermoanaerobaculaceae bacterium]|nr:penicillin-binding protein 2 [Thermoanaerobaculaceae bacterium]HRS17146.1 penicillin-binding protein 2 [Thermoanaerobaculaceae bacterium]